MLQQLLSPADPSIICLLERVAVSSSIKRMCECNYEPIGSAPAFRVQWYTSAPAYLPDPLSDFSKGLVLRLCIRLVIMALNPEFEICVQERTVLDIPHRWK